ncbi:Two-pore potassium channel 5 [Platanthera zijinensis]|uniref:Two-pore potassium channel 5 n=1 Tax=Platanthera zijinensis TaxID=2320716 RepID=A0AAP0BQ71_9ASPA
MVLLIGAFSTHHFKGLRLDEKNESIPRKQFFFFSIYFQVVSITTVGYGDIVPLTDKVKVLSCFIAILRASVLNLFISSIISDIFDFRKIRIRYITFTVLIIFVLGVVVIHFTEKYNFGNSLYLTIMSFTSVGYDDISFKSSHGRLFASIWLILATTAWYLILNIVPIIIKRHRRDHELQRYPSIYDLTTRIRLEEKYKYVSLFLFSQLIC